MGEQVPQARQQQEVLSLKEKKWKTKMSSMIKRA